jgi:hypothetical protein
MRQVNDHVKQALSMKLTERVITPKTVKLKKQVWIRERKKDYTKSLIWILLGIITITIWATIYNLIF